MTSLVGDVASVAPSVHAALGGISAGSSAGSTGSRALLNGGGGNGGCSVAGSRAGLLNRSSGRSTSSKDLGARTLCRVIGLATPHAEVNSSVLDVVNTGNFDGFRGEGVATTGDLDLRAAVVELCLAIMGAVETDVLSTHKVFAVGDALGNLEGHTVLLPSAPSIRLGVAAGVADSLLEDFEPFTGAIICSSAVRCLGHVDLSGTRMLHACSYSKGHSQLISSLDIGSSLGSLVGGSNVAAEVNAIRSSVVECVLPLGGHISHRSSIGAHKLRRCLARNDKFVEKIVCRCQRHHAGQEGNSNSLVHHLEMLDVEDVRTKVFSKHGLVERMTEVNEKNDRPSCRRKEGRKRE